MKISEDKTIQDLIKNIKQIPDHQKVKCINIDTRKNKKISEERVELSKKASGLNKISRIIQKTPDIREEKVALLRKKIASGNYSISGKKIADKMIKEFLLEDVLKS